jgi:integrase
VFTSDEVFRFIDTASDVTFLLPKLVLLFCYFGALRMSECQALCKSDVKITPDGLLVKIIRKKTDKAGVGQSFIVPIQYLDMYKEYMYLTSNCESIRLWMTYDKKKENYKNIPMGINTLRKIPSQIAAFMGLENPQEYTGHSLRATSATVLADSGVSMENLKRHGHWKSASVVEGYIRESKRMKSDIAGALSSNIPSVNPLPNLVESQPPNITTSTRSLNPAPFFVNCVFERNFLYNQKDI